MVFKNATHAFNLQVGVKLGCWGFSSQPAYGIPQDFAILFILLFVHVGSCA